MPVSSPQQMSFGGGINANLTPTNLPEDTVATATNIDFSFEPGAAAVRQGSVRVLTNGAGEVRNLFKHYKNTLGNSVLYAHIGNSVFRILNPGSQTSIISGMSSEQSGFTSFKDHFYVVSTAGGTSVKDDGATASDWIKQSPATAPTIDIQSLTPFPIGTVYWAGEGTLVGTATQTGTATITQPDTPFRMQLNAIVPVTDMSTNAGNPIDDYGIDSVEIKFSDPSKVTRISRDYSIGDGDFINYWHTELDVDLSEDMLTNVDRLIDSQITEGASTDVNIDAEARQTMVSVSRLDIRSPRTRISAAADSWNLWAVSRPQFELVSKKDEPDGWTNIGAVRIIIECSAPVQVTVRNWQVAGAKTYPLNDAQIGYVWWETFATLDSGGNIVGESAPSAASIRYRAQGGRALTTGATSPTGNHGVTHRILYRSGGYMRDGYAVATNSIGTATYTDSVTDIQALSVNKALDRSTIPRASFYNNIVAASEPHYDRIFVGYLNNIAWSSPGRPDIFPRRSVAQISHAGDEVKGIVVWPPGLIVVNRDSVYEIDGNLFEGREANMIIRRTGARHGSKAQRTIIKTPYGIPLLDLDGLYMYAPGQGIDAPIQWVMDNIGDAWRGTALNDPAIVKGDRVPAINRSQIHHSCAEWWNNKLYLAMPTGASTRPNTLFVLDFTQKRVWFYQYPFNITALLWDVADAKLLAGTPDGAVMQIEFNTQDQNVSATPVDITWSLRTRQWSAPTDAVLENVAFEYAGGTATVTAIYDNTSTASVGIAANASRDWHIPPLSGQVKNNVQFKFVGTQASGQQNILYGVKFDALVEPERVRFWRTEHDLANSEGEKQWDVHYGDLEILGATTVLGTVYIDNVAVMTATMTGPTNGRKVHVQGFPPETYGHVKYVVYNEQGNVGTFKHWQSYSSARPEPPRTITWVSTKTCGDEHEWKTFEPCINPQGGTTVATAMIDGVARATYTMTGNNKQSYAFALPSEAYGRTVYTTYSGSVPWKFYDERWEGVPEPDVVTNWKHGPIPFASRNNLRTWVAQLNPRGVCTGVLWADNTPLTTATFTGNDKQNFVTGLDVNNSLALQTATLLEIYYTGTGTGSGIETGRTGFKHYDTQIESTPKPFGKTTWSIVYTKIGGATQIDMARWWSYDIEAIGTATVTSIWDIDGTATNTQTFTVVGRQWNDRIAWPPGVYGRIWQQRVLASGPIQIHKVNLDIERVGVKGFSRVTYAGTPRNE